jgi:hypothetical protein
LVESVRQRRLAAKALWPTEARPRRKTANTLLHPSPAGRLVVVEASTDLVNWLPLWTNTFAGSLNFNDPRSGVSSNHFYRAHLP